MPLKDLINSIVELEKQARVGTEWNVDVVRQEELLVRLEVLQKGRALVAGNKGGGPC